ncbi:TIGR02647 family protein, partial [Vibrio sp. 1865]
MKYSAEHIAELNLLLQFDLSSAATGIKVHSDASEEMQAAVARLY